MLIPSFASAQMSGNMLTVHAGDYQRMIRKQSVDLETAAKANLFVGYTLAVADMLMTLGTICPTEGTRGAQILERVSRTILSRPELSHRSAMEMVSMSLVGAYPCNAAFVPQTIPHADAFLPGRTPNVTGR